MDSYDQPVHLTDETSGPWLPVEHQAKTQSAQIHRPIHLMHI